MLIDEVRAQDVKDARTFAKFVQQNFGTPYATVGDIKTLNAQAKRLFGEHPNMDWQSLVKVAYWCHSKKRRMARVYQYVNQFRWAYADGVLTLDSSSGERELDEEIHAALLQEENPAWRAKLSRADGGAAKAEVLRQWKEIRQQS